MNELSRRDQATMPRIVLHAFALLPRHPTHPASRHIILMGTMNKFAEIKVLCTVRTSMLPPPRELARKETENLNQSQRRRR